MRPYHSQCWLGCETRQADSLRLKAECIVATRKQQIYNPLLLSRWRQRATSCAWRRQDVRSPRESSGRSFAPPWASYPTRHACSFPSCLEHVGLCAVERHGRKSISCAFFTLSFQRGGYDWPCLIHLSNLHQQASNVGLGYATNYGSGVTSDPQSPSTAGVLYVHFPHILRYDSGKDCDLTFISDKVVSWRRSKKNASR